MALATRLDTSRSTCSLVDGMMFCWRPARNLGRSDVTSDGSMSAINKKSINASARAKMAEEGYLHILYHT